MNISTPITPMFKLFKHIDCDNYMPYNVGYSLQLYNQDLYPTNNMREKQMKGNKFNKSFRKSNKTRKRHITTVFQNDSCFAWYIGKTTIFDALILYYNTYKW